MEIQDALDYIEENETDEEHMRQKQASIVMPLIGPLLDAWDGLPNDELSALRESAPNLCKKMDEISEAMENID